MRSNAIYFDMDGTIADFYGVENWLDYLLCENELPYQQAKPLLNLQALAHRLNNLQKQGYHIGIVSWCSKNGSRKFNSKVIEAKKKWLNTHLKSVNFDEIKIISYGVPKSTAVKYPYGFLFDDEYRNRKEWKGIAFDEANILESLKVVSTSLAACG